MKLLIILFRIIFSLIHLLLFTNKLTNFNIEYIKFGKIDFINEFSFEKLFYITLFTELILSISIWFLKLKIIQIIFEFIFFSYTAITFAYYIYLNYFFKGCIDCNYSIGFNTFSAELMIVINLIFFIFYEMQKKYNQKNNN